MSGVFVRVRSHDRWQGRIAPGLCSGVAAGFGACSRLAPKEVYFWGFSGPHETIVSPTMRTYEVEAGDTLSKIASDFYGDANLWNAIYQANRDKLSDPNMIYVGQVLRIPDSPYSPPHINPDPPPDVTPHRPSTFQQIGPKGYWKSTVAAVGAPGDHVYTCDQNGHIYQIGFDGSHAKVGSSTAWRSRFLMRTQGWLCTLEQDGTLFRIDPANGTYHKIGKDAQWVSTVTAVATGGKIYTCDKNGKLYCVDIHTGDYHQLGNSASWNARFLLDVGGAIATLEANGTFYRVELDGSYAQFGHHGTWGSTQAAVGVNTGVLTCDKTGLLYQLNTHDGSFHQIGGSHWKSRYLLASESHTFSLEEDGTLYSISWV